MECMASGVPCIMSNNTGHEDVVGDHCLTLRREEMRMGEGWGGHADGWGGSSVAEVVEKLEQLYADRAAAQELGR
jgi:hypothetical protein